MVETIIADGCTVTVDQAFLPKNDADALFRVIKEKVEFQPEMGLFGRKPKRTSCAFGDGGSIYKYANTIRKAHEWFPELLSVKEAIEAVAECEYNFALVNYYPDGDAGIDWHSDNEKTLDRNVPIASLSVGATRKFKMKAIQTGAVTDTWLQHGSLLLMGPGTQSRYKHSVPKTKLRVGERFNITFRRILS